MATEFIRNGKAQVVNVDSSTPLLYVLRDTLGLKGPKFGCGLGQCGECTVIIKEEAIPILMAASRRSHFLSSAGQFVNKVIEVDLV